MNATGVAKLPQLVLVFVVIKILDVDKVGAVTGKSTRLVLARCFSAGYPSTREVDQEGCLLPTCCSVREDRREDPTRIIDADSLSYSVADILGR